MRVRVLVCTLLLALVAGRAQAQLAVSGGLEYMHWAEDTQPISVRERGVLATVGLAFTQNREKGFLFAYRGKLYFGDVDYDGALLFAPSVPVTGTTRYTGVANEAQLRYRVGYGLDFLAAGGVDVWERELSATQKEDYTIAFVRLGVESNSKRNGWLFGAGIKYPVWTRENAHFDDLGYDQNPYLKPGKSVSVFGQVGYRFRDHWALIGYLDSFRFSQSNLVSVTRNGVPAGAFYQPASDLYVVGLKLEYSF
jgi:hypothetical protein